MLSRDQVKEEILHLKNNNILCELPTSFGKSKIALELLQNRVPLTKTTKILIVIPRLVLIDTWKKEFEIWGAEKYLPYVEFVTYVSFYKKASIWDMVIFDEAHHLSIRCREALDSFTVKYYTLLSATVGRNLLQELKATFTDLHVYTVTTRNAIKEEILPDPKVYLIPLDLDNTQSTFSIIKNSSQKIELTIPYSQRFNYSKIKNRKIIIKCTQKQYYEDLSSIIAWYKNRMFSDIYKNLFLRKSGERLKWLSEQKSAIIISLLDHLKKQRTLTFCNGIKQTEEFGKYCINSKNKSSDLNLQKFNKGEVNHITACNMLDEGVNLTNCRIGIYAILNSSERMIKQKLGRLLRHKDPIIIIPYFKNTREEEIVQKMLEDYNSALVKKINNIKDIQL